ncbi:MAG: anthranilate phosphoribosyltransferase [Deltaproteobacteria bacterium]|nr:anthranilate phosphoribosyltransferase [Deltaproteobacteria bacterium]
MSLREALEFAVRGEEVAAELLEAAFGEIMDGKASEAAIAGLLIALRTKGETVGEIVATARALRARADTAPLARADAIDTCGTGGDGAGTFNVSTAAAFVVAGAGVPVAKHGNRAASSRSGSADVLEALGVRVDLPIAEAARVLDDVGIAFFFARRAHPAMRFVAPVRQELGVRTLMNCLGPLLNPVGVRRQLVGVYERGLVERLAEALGALGSERALVVHGSDGLDELTTTGPSWAAHWRKGAVETLEIDPQALGIAVAAPEALRGGDAAQNAGILRRVLDGSEGPERDLVLLNAAAALWVADAAGDLKEGLVRARESVDSGAARERLAALVRASAEAGAAS